MYVYSARFLYCFTCFELFGAFSICAGRLFPIPNFFLYNANVDDDDDDVVVVVDG